MRRKLQPAEFLSWAKSSAVPLGVITPGLSFEDLRVLGEMIGDASLVALSEGIHGAAEPLDFRNRIFQYLVREKAFTAIALESGLVESHLVHDYVRGGSGDLAAILSEGLSWTFDRLPQNRELIRWLREFNQDRGLSRKVNFYGFDVSGSPGNRIANRGVDTALVEALEFLRRVDNAASARFRACVDAEITCYHELCPSQRDALTAAIADLIALLERKEAEYTAASTPDAYDWGYRAAICARQVDNMLRQTSQHEQDRSLFVVGEIRDRHQVDNLEWIVRREGADGKILIFAHTYHLSGAPVTKFEHRHEVAGTYLRRRFGKRLVTIGNLIGKGTYGCEGYAGTLEPASHESMDGLAASLDIPLFLLDLRSAPIAASKVLDEAHLFRPGPGQMGAVVRQAFDILFYIDVVTAVRTHA